MFQLYYYGSTPTHFALCYINISVRHTFIWIITTVIDAVLKLCTSNALSIGTVHLWGLTPVTKIYKDIKHISKGSVTVWSLYSTMVSKKAILFVTKACNSALVSIVLHNNNVCQHKGHMTVIMFNCGNVEITLRSFLSYQ